MDLYGGLGAKLENFGYFVIKIVLFCDHFLVKFATKTSLNTDVEIRAPFMSWCTSRPA